MILIIDHYDSFIDMIADYVKSLGYEYELIKTDSPKLSTIDIEQYSHIIIGPGPGHPKDNSLRIIDKVIEQSINHDIPLLGICLGHQLIGQYFGSNIITADFIAHGIVNEIEVINKSRLFANLPNKFNVTRYHSLIIENNSLNPNLAITATTDRNEIMAIEHSQHHIYGLQFHPESIMTEYGHEILANFLNI